MLTTRLIPAHAGKTRRRTTGASSSSAHPRSRGENCYNVNGNKGVTGSSPLTRGKRVAATRRRGRSRLIPAHAGKTGGPPPSTPGLPAHPRSRGENPGVGATTLTCSGSSPLTRGKRIRRSPDSSPNRLIPAHAGKTIGEPISKTSPPAHPRSRGENATRTSRESSVLGSSPLTRGKRRRERPGHRDGRLIPAHAGKTACSCAAWTRRRAHPRSRGENTL